MDTEWRHAVGNSFPSSFNKSTRRANHFRLSEIASSPSDKNISVLQKWKSGYILPIPSRSEGRCAGHQCGAGMQWTRMALLTRALEADGRNRVVPTPSGWCQVRSSGVRATVAKVQSSPRRACISRKLPRRESRIASAGPVCSCAPSTTSLHTRPRVQRASGFPCAL